MEQVFANDENAILESDDKHQLETRLKTARPLLDEEEKRLTATSSPKFGAYLSNNEKMMRRSMIRNARKKAGMPTDKMGNVLRSYTNQSETVNNKLTRQKEAIIGKAKSKSGFTKLEFVRDVWEQVDQQQQLELQLAICGLSEEYELADQVHYLSVNPEVWFEWPVEKRMEYTRKFNELTVEDVAKKKVISLDKHHGKEDTEQEWKEFSRDIQSIYSLPGLSVGLVTTVIKEAEKLLNCPNSVERMPSMNPTDPKTKYFVAAKDAKTGMYECVVHHDHVTCKCPCNKYNGLCKHSLCVAERANLLKEHVDFLLKSSCRNKPSKSNLVEPHKNAAGKKGSSHRNPWRPGREKSGDSANSQQGTSSHGPYSAIHHNDKPLIVCFLSDQAKATECRQCRIEFPRRKKVIPYDIVLSHEERWMYPNPKKPSEKLPSAKFTKKFYCVKSTCVTSRFPYFDSSYLEIPTKVREALKDAHMKLLQVELGHNEK